MKVTKTTPIYTISVFSKLTELSPDVLRYLDKLCILKPSIENNRRLYSNENLRVESFDSKEPVGLWWMKYVHPEIIK